MFSNGRVFFVLIFGKGLVYLCNGTGSCLAMALYICAIELTFVWQWFCISVRLSCLMFGDPCIFVRLSWRIFGNGCVYLCDGVYIWQGPFLCDGTGLYFTMGVKLCDGFGLCLPFAKVECICAME